MTKTGNTIAMRALMSGHTNIHALFFRFDKGAGERKVYFLAISFPAYHTYVVSRSSVDLVKGYSSRVGKVLAIKIALDH